MSSADVGVRRRYVDTRAGQMHLAECGNGTPVLFLHQTPRSWTEYIDVLPVAGRHMHAMALDTLGFGQSAHTDELSIERFADGVEAVLVCGAEDTYSLPDQPALAQALGCELTVIDGGGVSLPEQQPAAFAEAVRSFAAPTRAG